MLIVHSEKKLKNWFVFFSPTYFSILVMFAAALYGIINMVSFLLLLIYGVFLVVSAFVLQEYYPKLFSHYGRSFYHFIGGVIIVAYGIYANTFFLNPTPLMLLVFTVFVMFLSGWMLERVKVETLFSMSHILSHVEEYKKSTFYEAGTLWLLACILLLLFFDARIAYASILVLAFGDSSASFFGRTFGRTKNPINPSKTLEGTWAFFATAIFGAMLFVPASAAIIAAAVAAIVESLPMKINDNLAVPLSAGVIMYLFSMI